jgi:hypothetical protein
MIITANELKTKGVSSIKKAVEMDSVAFLSVRGKKKYAVIPVADYSFYREVELQRAIEETENDIKNGKFSSMTSDEYISELEKCLK